ncbi:MAG: exodeoxyribonuclease VII small subunit [Halanaerobiaceae bacterium]
MAENEDIKFEEALTRLEDIVNKLEDGGLPLDKSLETFTEGIKLIKLCNKELNEAEKKIEKVLMEDGQYTDTVSFHQEEELS